MNRKIGFIIYVIVFQVCWHLLDLAYNTFITGRGYQFDSGIDIAFPIVLALLTGYFFVLKRGEKKADDYKGAGKADED